MFNLQSTHNAPAPPSSPGLNRRRFQWRRPTPLTLVFSLFGLVMVLFLLLPLATMTLSVSPKLLYTTLLEEEVWRAILLSVSSGLWATFFGLLFGVPLAYVLARHRFPGKRIVNGLVDLPVVIPHTAAGIALLSVFGRKFYGGKLFGLLGINFVGAEPGIVIAMMFGSVPFLVNAARDGFMAVDPRMEQVAQSLGASPWKTFLTITLPLARRNILTGAMLMWSRGISEFGAVFILVYHPMVAPVLAWNRFETYGLDYARPVAVLLLIMCILVFLTLKTLGMGKPAPRSRADTP
ncbi:MAG: ABC transporter permease [Nitrospirae bacterium]|nr:ABC transporter permease [Nitrospirota bacterium]